MTLFYVTFVWGKSPVKSWARYPVEAKDKEQARERAIELFNKKHGFTPEEVEVMMAWP